MGKFEPNEIVILIQDDQTRVECRLIRHAHDYEFHREGLNGSGQPWVIEIPGRRGRHASGWWVVAESNLRKRPDDNLFTQWFESHIITDIRPTETQIREGLKGILEPFGSGEK